MSASLARLFASPSRRRRRTTLAVEALESRRLMTISYSYASEGLHELEVVGRDAGTGNWWATGFDLHADDNAYDAGTELLAKWSTAVDWRHVRTGDFDGDGLDDLAGWDPSSGNWWTSMSDQIGSTTFLAGRWTNALTWNHVAAVDLASDGDRADPKLHFVHKADLVGLGSNGQWWAAVSNGDGTFTNRLLTSWSATAGWRDVQFLDIDANGETDILGRTSSGQWWAAMNRGGLAFENVFVTTWNEAAGWKDVRHVWNFFGDNREAVFGRASDGTWWTLRFQGSGTSHVVAPVGKWNEALGWRDVVSISGTPNARPGVILGRTATGEWHQLSWNLHTGTGRMAFVGKWDESAGWRDVRAYQAEREGQAGLGPRVGVIGRDATGVWQVGILRQVGDPYAGLYSNRFDSPNLRWSAATTWRDVAVADATRSPVTALHRQVASGGVDTYLDIVIYGHRKGTAVLVEDAPNEAVKVTFSVPATGFTREYLISPRGYSSISGILWDVNFHGHYGADSFTNHSTRPAMNHGSGQEDSGAAYGYAGDDTFDTVNTLFDELYGGDGLDVLLGDPEDTIVQDA